MLSENNNCRIKLLFDFVFSVEALNYLHPCQGDLIDFLSLVPVDDNPVDDSLQRARFLSSLQLWQHQAAGFQFASWGRLQEIGYRAHRNIAAGDLFNISAATFAPPSEDHAPL